MSYHFLPDRGPGSLVWLTGVLCSPTRLPLALAFTLGSFFRRCRKMGMPKIPDIVILSIFSICFVTIYLTLWLIQDYVDIKGTDRHWLVGLSINLIGYGAIFLPGLIIFKYVKNTGYLERGPTKCLGPMVRLCFFGSEETIDDAIAKEESANAKGGAAANNLSDCKTFLNLLICFGGLQLSYLTWGVLQEKIMTRKYEDSAGNVGLFKDSQFLVFVNRVLAFAVALLYITVSRQPKHRAPIYKYSFCSFSNIMSSWCQYEALKFVSFPTQVLAKASKVIPVMIMGKIVSNKKYDTYEYVVAVLITLGMVAFLYGSEDMPIAGKSATTTVSGVILLIGYMTCDSFTTNWQNKMFESYEVSPVQAMCGVNFFSFLLTSVSLLQQGAFYKSLVFMSQFPKFGFDCIILSLCSAVGNLFIYRTINLFGPVAFIIIMTLRQVIAFLLSCIIYGHIVTATGIIGVSVVFSATFLRIYCSYKLRKKKQALQLIKAQQQPEVKA